MTATAPKAAWIHAIRRSPPVTGIQTHHTRPQPIEADGGREQRLRAGGIVAVGRGDDAEQGQAGAATQLGVDAQLGVLSAARLHCLQGSTGRRAGSW